MSDIDTKVVASPKTLDPDRPIREADMCGANRDVRFGPEAEVLSRRFLTYVKGNTTEASAFVDLSQKGSSMEDFDQRWTQAFALLLAFKRREGHTRVPRDHIEKGFRLGQWVAVQRYYRRKREMLSEREKRLNAIGFVWSRRDWLWERGFAALQKFKKREGHCLVHALHVEGDVKLGNWLTVQRRAKNKMSRERKRRLDELGFVWWGRVPRKTMLRLRPDKPGTGGRAHPS